jgi:predicted naringenin-chalcone synthase
MTDLSARPLRHGGLSPSRRQVALLGLGTATPPAVSQQQATALAEEFTCTSDGQRAWLRRVFSRCGVGHRGTVLRRPDDPGIDSVRAFYGPPAVAGERGPTTATRMDRYAAEAPPLAERAARAALAAAGLAPAAVTHLITVSCTGFHAPGLDVELITRLALPPHVRRTHIGFMGCHAAFNALAAARDAVRADPAATVLVCCVELSTLHFAYGWRPEKLIANALFADGAAACVLGAPAAPPPCPPPPPPPPPRTPPPPPPDSRDAMTWTVGDHGFEMTLSAALPDLIGRHIRPWCEAWLAEQGLALADISHWAIHPGGPRILAAARDALGLVDADLHASTAVLHAHGNMSSATILFVLNHLTRPLPAAPPRDPGLCLAIGFGPGLMAEALLLEL